MTIVVLDSRLQTEINRISEFNSVNKKLLEDFAYFILNDYLNPKDYRKKDNSLSLNELKDAVYQHFQVKQI